jgi:hypothetical protein
MVGTGTTFIWRSPSSCYLKDINLVGGAGLTGPLKTGHNAASGRYLNDKQGGTARIPLVPEFGREVFYIHFAATKWTLYCIWGVKFLTRSGIDGTNYLHGRQVCA